MSGLNLPPLMVRGRVSASGVIHPFSLNLVLQGYDDALDVPTAL
jgi:hypothetical protein